MATQILNNRETTFPLWPLFVGVLNSKISASFHFRLQQHRQGQAALVALARPVHEMQINDIVIYFVQESIRCLLIKVFLPSAATVPICFPFFSPEPHIKPPSNCSELSAFPTTEPSFFTTATPSCTYHALLAHAVKFPSTVKMTINLPPALTLPKNSELLAKSSFHDTFQLLG